MLVGRPPLSFAISSYQLTTPHFLPVSHNHTQYPYSIPQTSFNPPTLISPTSPNLSSFLQSSNSIYNISHPLILLRHSFQLHNLVIFSSHFHTVGAYYKTHSLNNILKRSLSGSGPLRSASGFTWFQQR